MPDAIFTHKLSLLFLIAYAIIDTAQRLAFHRSPMGRLLFAPAQAANIWLRRSAYAPYAQVSSIQVVRLGTAVAAIMSLLAGGMGLGPLLGLLLLTQVTSAWLFRAGGNGADQMATLMFIAHLGRDYLPVGSPQAALNWFIYLQLIACYFISGTAKLLSPTWRKAVILPLLLTNHSYGRTCLAGLFQRAPASGAFLQSALIAWEVTFPVVLIGSDWAKLWYFGAGTVFHTAAAWAMGLNTFWLIFLSAYCFVFPWVL